MGDPAYEARREAERIAAERRAAHSSLAEEVAVILLEAAKGFFQGHGRLVIDRIDDTRSTVRYEA